jgi:HK97 family phage major capsid protein
MPEPGENESQSEFMHRCVPMVMEDGTAKDNDQAVAICMSKWRKKKSIDLTVKVTAKTDEFATVAGYGVVFGGVDLEGDTFLPETDFMLDMVPAKPVFYDHTLTGIKHHLGKSIVAKVDEYGLWVEAQIDRAKEYAEYVLELVEKGILGWSSGSVPHLVERGEKGFARWPIFEFSLTPTPAEPRTLSVQQIKSLLSAANVDYPEALAEASQDAPARAETGGDAETTQEMKAMDEVAKVETPVAPPIDVAAIAKAVADHLKAEAPEDKGAVLTVPSIKKVSDLGFKDDEVKSFFHWIKTGDSKAYKAAMQGQTDDEGGYAVPDDFYNRIVAKRDEQSVARRAGAVVIPTSLDRILVPKEGTSMSAFAITAEEGAVDENEPTLGQTVITVYTGTKLVKLSNQLLADEKAQLDGFLSNAFGRAEAEWENTYFLEGSGSSQPYGAVDGSTAGKSAAGSAAVTAAEVIALGYALDEPYFVDGEVSWTMRRTTLGALRALAASYPFSFAVSPQGGGNMNAETLLGAPVFCSAKMATWGSATKPILIGNWSFYFIAERQGMTIQRLTELYAGNLQTGLLATFRRGGSPIQAEAFQHMLLAT